MCVYMAIPKSSNSDAVSARDSLDSLTASCSITPWPEICFSRRIFSKFPNERLDFPGYFFPRLLVAHIFVELMFLDREVHTVFDFFVTRVVRVVVVSVCPPPLMLINSPLPSQPELLQVMMFPSGEIGVSRIPSFAKSGGLAS